MTYAFYPSYCSKTHTINIHLNEGFDFLGFNLRHDDGKLLIKPQKQKVHAFCQKLGKLIRKMAAVKQEVLIFKLNPILQSFANYYQGVVSKETYSYIFYRVWLYL